ncbi:MAG: hypothetical protein U9N33_03110 [Campylobacterota bacterium]|nr:hypothetical protein [Campylobacterota bacterium]
MKKILSMTLVSALTLVFYTGCSSASPAPDSSSVEAVKDVKISEQALHVNTRSNEKIAHAIKKAGDKTGWKITEFKSNEVIAEKTDDGETVSSGIKFNQGYIEFENNSATSDLRDAIEEEFEKNSSAH